MSDATPETPKGGGILRYRFHGIPVVPVLGISALAIGGYFLYQRYRNSKTSAVVQNTTPAPSTDYTGDTGAWANIGGGASYDDSNGTSTALSSTGSSTTTSTEPTNTAWANNAINGLVGQGQYTPIDIQNAIQNEINGQPLTALQSQIVNAAIAAYGEPPEPITQTVISGTAQVTSGYHPYVTKKGDTVDGVLQATYGRVDPTIKKDFFAVNGILKTIQGWEITANQNQSGTYAPGQTIHLPIFTEGTLP